MILNAYSVLALFVGVIEMALGGLVAGASFAALGRKGREAASGADRKSRLPLLLLASGALLGVSVAAWPLLYLLLASYVPQWEGVMCIQGVVRIGTGGSGAPGWLPALAQTLQATKPLLVFAMGTAILVQRIDRRTRTSPLSGRLPLVLAAAGLLAIVDAGVQIAYVSIPKTDASLARGCCTATAPSDASLPAATTAAARAGESPARTGIFAAFYAAILSLAGWTWFAARRSPRGPVHARAGTLPLFVAAISVLPVGVVFLREVAAPALLELPFHHCAYCLVTRAPLGLLGIVLFILGVFATGWACLARWLGESQESRHFLPASISMLLTWALFGWIGAALLTSVELAMA